MTTQAMALNEDASDAFAGMDATAQAELVRNGDVSPVELVDAAIRRVERLDPSINATVSVDFELARKQAARASRQGVFAGVPTLIKDLTSYPGHRAGYGSRLFAGVVAPSGSAYTEALDATGLIVLGKSATSEFGLLGTTETAANGATRNPWELSRSPGGSSGGAVAAVASGMVPVAHASDGGGSIRGPSSFCGLFGFKPSRWRTLNAGMPDAMPTAGLISDHCVSRSVRDSANWLIATERPGLADPLPPVAGLRAAMGRRLKIGAYRTDCFGLSPDADANAALDSAVALCRLLGHEVVETEGPAIDSRATSEAFFALTGFGLGAMIDQVRQMMGDAFDPMLLEPYTRDIIERARRIAPEALHGMGAALQAASHVADAAIAGFDVLLSPTVPFAALPLGQHGPADAPQTLDAFTTRLAGTTVVASLAGWPAMSVPLHWTPGGLPVGAHFAASRGADAMLFSLAFQLEDAQPWVPRLNALRERLM